MIVLRDVTELIQAEQSRSIEKLSDVMIASTSHDMRTPLNTIVNMQTMIESRIDDPLLLKWLNIAKTSTNLLLYLVNDTLDFY
jgi:signal transduction histidine kinase